MCSKKNNSNRLLSQEKSVILRRFYMHMSQLVSIIMPVYNNADYLENSISSVINQTYPDWELIVVDDCSSDSSSEIVKRFASEDDRIHLYRTPVCSGSPIVPRNLGIEKSKGRYISFLDSDDVWLPSKLQHQLDCFAMHPEAFLVFSDFEKISQEGIRHNRVLSMPMKVDYRKLLEGNVIGCLTAIYDSEKIGKRFFPSCGHEDYALWLSLLRKGGEAFNTGYVDALYRVRKNSISSNKFVTMRWQWVIYRRIESINLFLSLFYFVKYAYHAIRKSWI